MSKQIDALYDEFRKVHTLFIDPERANRECYAGGYAQAESDLAPAVRLAEAYRDHVNETSRTPKDSALLEAAAMRRAVAFRDYIAASAQPARDPLAELSRLLSADGWYDHNTESDALERARALCAEAIRRAK